jgi:hypothetical protein
MYLQAYVKATVYGQNMRKLAMSAILTEEETMLL